MPLTLSAIRLGGVNTVIPEKTCMYKKIEVLTAWMGDSWSNIFDKGLRGLRSLLPQDWENCWGLESGSVTGSIVSVLEFAIGKQNYRKIDHFTTSLFGIFQKLWLFYPECQSQNKNSSFLSVCMSNFNCLFSGPLCSPELFHKVESDVFILFFFSILRTDFRWNPCLRSWKNSSFFTILFARKRVWSFA